MRTNGGSAMRSIPSRRSVLYAVTPLPDSPSSCELGWASDDGVSGRDNLEDLYFDDFPEFVVRSNHY